MNSFFVLIFRVLPGCECRREVLNNGVDLALTLSNIGGIFHSIGSQVGSQRSPAGHGLGKTFGDVSIYIDACLVVAFYSPCFLDLVDPPALTALGRSTKSLGSRDQSVSDGVVIHAVIK